MPEDASNLAGRKILVALTGGIAAYKTATLVSRLAQAGAEVRVIMTEAATKFITPLTLQSLSGHPVLTSMWQHDDRPDSQHVGLARWCDQMVIAPCSADMLAKLAAGLTPDLVSLTVCALPSDTPLLVAPAMNADMWDSPIVQRNLQTLRDLLPNFNEVGPAKGWQACRTSGSGRMSEADEIKRSLVDISIGTDE
ncbi:flavoprotein [Algisphaera agarilytica]|uniref:Phosphopantothenoylcysteine decarboxylase/phosphopantothenate--cysteine ligase n=1 Tax=Algisphaera agarilytica TaxID=1385975 RepID=A0A7X0H5V1_9BACT|nr:flavoprotein [Algisphaera agarilytica]MBB6428365.1 phosphopantothenoylcysteine decarboxylase/phosphopantothenate--cysteine ligase [Algisphaera agarilytica]